MSTTPLTDAITALTTYSNTVTGASDTDLSSAVATLAAGYGQGGGGEDTLKALLDNTLTDFEYSGSGVITQNLFSRKTALKNIKLSGVTLNGTAQFSSCTSLELARLDGVTSLGTNATFQNAGKDATKLVIVLPSATSCPSDCFRACNVNAVVDFGPNFTSLGIRSFYGNSFVGTIILRSSSVVTCGNSNAISSIVSGGSAIIYVPQSLIATYQNDTNWSLAYAAGVTFTAIEGSQYENYYADGTAISS